MATVALPPGATAIAVLPPPSSASRGQSIPPVIPSRRTSTICGRPVEILYCCAHVSFGLVHAMVTIGGYGLAGSLAAYTNLPSFIPIAVATVTTVAEGGVIVAHCLFNKYANPTQVSRNEEATAEEVHAAAESVANAAGAEERTAAALSAGVATAGAEVTQTAANVEALRKRIADLEGQLREAGSTIASVQGLNTRLQTQLDQIQATIRAFNGSITDAHRENQAFKEELATLGTELVPLLADAHRVEVSVAHLDESFNRELQTLGSAIQTVKTDSANILAKLKLVITGLTEQIAALREQVSRMTDVEHGLEEKTRLLAALEAQRLAEIARLEQLQRDQASLQASIDTTVAAIARARAEGHEDSARRTAAAAPILAGADATRRSMAELTAALAADTAAVTAQTDVLKRTMPSGSGGGSV